MKKFIIETAYSKETYYCDNIDNFLAETCFCDNYEVISESETELEKINLYNETLEKLTNDGFKIDNFWNNNALLLVKGYYTSYQEMINNNR
jgi:hypothetical protein